MRVCGCCCACCLFAGVLLRWCCVCRWLYGVWGVVCVVVGFASLRRTDVWADACVGWISEQKRSLWTATGLSFGPSTRVLGACLCVCPQEPAGWPGCGNMRRWVSLDPCFACAWRVGVCVCVWLGVLCCACWLLAALFGRSCVWRLCRPRDLSRAQVGTRACACCVWAVVCPSPLPFATAAPAAAFGRTTSSTWPRRKRERGREGVDWRLVGRWLKRGGCSRCLSSARVRLAVG